MHVAITHLKAPWPAGAQVGEVVDLGEGPVPECFAGKCVPAQEGAVARHTYARPAGPVDPLAALRAQLAAALEENVALKALLEAGGGGSGPIKPNAAKK